MLWIALKILPAGIHTFVFDTRSSHRTISTLNAFQLSTFCPRVAHSSGRARTDSLVGNNIANSSLTALTYTRVNTPGSLASRGCGAIPVIRALPAGFTSGSFGVSYAALGTRTGKRSRGITAYGRTMAGSRFGTFIDINTLPIQRYETGLAVANGFVIFCTATTLSTCSCGARVDAFLELCIASQFGCTVVVSFTFNFVTTKRKNIEN